MVKYILSKRGQPRLVMDQHIFWVESRDSGTIRWKCNNYQRTGCRARITTVAGEIDDSRCNLHHNHIADAAAIEAAECIEKIREQSQNSRDRPR